MVEKCNNCGSSDIEHDEVRGENICNGCATIVSDHGIINDIQFTENAKGQSAVIGHTVDHDQNALTVTAAGIRSCSKESRQVTLNNALKRIKNLASILGLHDDCIQQAHNFYKLCLSRDMTRGRKSAHIIGSCVYIACRVLNMAVMMIEISDALEMDVFELGHTFLKVKEHLCLQNNSKQFVDPSMYIAKFANKLELGNMEHTVANTATRLVNRMMLDYVHVGRRPSGVSGAALIIAARYHNFNRTINDIVKIARVHETTIRKRLIEFGNTDTSDVSLEEFMNQIVPEGKGEDPPSYKAARRKEEEERIGKIFQENRDIQSRFDEYKREIEVALEEKRSKMKRMRSAASSCPGSPTSSSGNDREHCDTVQFIAEATMASISEYLETESQGGKNSNREADFGLLPTTQTLNLTQTIEQSMEILPTETEVKDTSRLDLEGIDDDEIDSYILSESERERKTEIWMRVNKEYLDEMEKKKEQERLEEEQRERDGIPPKKKKVYKKKEKNLQPARTAGEAMERLIKEKKLSNRIDYDVLKSLNGESEQDFDKQSTTSKASSSRSSRSSRRKAAIGPLSDDFKSIISSISQKEAEKQRKHQEEDEAAFAPLLKKQKLIEEKRKEVEEPEEKASAAHQSSFVESEGEDEQEIVYPEPEEDYEDYSQADEDDYYSD